MMSGRSRWLNTIRITRKGEEVCEALFRPRTVAEFEALPTTPSAGGFWRQEYKICWGLDETKGGPFLSSPWKLKVGHGV